MINVSIPGIKTLFFYMYRWVDERRHKPQEVGKCFIKSLYILKLVIIFPNFLSAKKKVFVNL